MLVDSHCHLNMLDLTSYDGEMKNLIQAAKDEGVEKFLCVGVNLTDALEPIQIAEQFDEVKASVGVHPSEEIEGELNAKDIIELASHDQVVAIGETGLDYHYNEGDLTWQRDRFRLHINIAKELAKPLIIHTRDAKVDTMTILVEEGACECGGVMHCFTEDWEMAQQALDIGFYISIPGIVTFKNASQIVEVASKVPMDRLLIETDSPYLAPAPFRGKKNEPKYVKYVAQKIAEIRGITFDEVANATTKNYERLFLNL